MSNYSLEDQARLLLNQGQFSKAEGLFLKAFEQEPERLVLLDGVARSMMGPLDPLEFLERWVAPDERYRR